MKTPFRKGFRAAITFSVIMIFLMLIGFNTIAAALIGKVFGVTTSPTPVVFLGILYGLVGLWAGSSAARKKFEIATFSETLISGLSAGLVFGAFVAGFSWFMTNLYSGGVDLRNYLSALSPDVVNYYNFNLPPVQGSLLIFAIIVGCALAGALLDTYVFRNPAVTALPKKAAGVFKNPVVVQTWEKPSTKFVLLVLAVAAAVILPRLWGSYWNYILGTVGIYVLLGMGLNIIVGQSGQLVLGYVAFFAVGAYTVALLMAPTPHNIGMSFWLTLVIAIILAALTGFLIGLPIMRLRGDYLAIVTLGFGEIIRILLKSDLLTSFTGGPKGVTNIPSPTLFGKTFSSDIDFMYLIIIAMAITIFVTYRLQYSRIGRAWVAIREDETVAKATGVNVIFYKLLALAIGAAFAGLGGGIFAARNQFTGPEDHIMMVSINVLCLVIVGGMGSIPGVILGAFTLKGLPEILRELENYRMLAFGALLVVMMIVRPDGLWPASRPKIEKFKANAEETPPPGDGQEAKVSS